MRLSFDPSRFSLSLFCILLVSPILSWSQEYEIGAKFGHQQMFASVPPLEMAGFSARIIGEEEQLFVGLGFALSSRPHVFDGQMEYTAVDTVTYQVVEGTALMRDTYKAGMFLELGWIHDYAEIHFDGKDHFFTFAVGVGFADHILFKNQSEPVIPYAPNLFAVSYLEEFEEKASHRLSISVFQDVSLEVGYHIFSLGVGVGWYHFSERWNYGASRMESFRDLGNLMFKQSELGMELSLTYHFIL